MGQRLPVGVPTKEDRAQKNLSDMVKKSEPWRDIVIRTAQAEGVDPQLVFGLISVESSWDPNAKNGDHIGLGQIGRAAVKDVGGDYSKAADPETNILYTTRYLKLLLDRFHNPELALFAYHDGPTATAKYIRQLGDNAEPEKVMAMGTPEGKGYVDRINTYLPAFAPIIPAEPSEPGQPADISPPTPSPPPVGTVRDKAANWATAIQRFGKGQG